MHEEQMPRRHAQMRLGLYGFAIALIGFVIGFVGSHLESRVLGLVGFVITAAGVFTGWVSIVWRFVRFPGEVRRVLAAAPWRAEPAVDPRTGRPWLIRVICLAGFAAAGGLLLAVLLSATVPAGHALMRRLDGALDPGARFVVFGAALALVGFWRMQRWGVWLMAALMALSPVVLAAAGSPPVVWSNLLGPVAFLVIGVRHYRRMA